MKLSKFCLRSLLVIPVLIANSCAFILEVSPNMASGASSHVNKCSSVNLEVGITWGTGGLAGHAGIPFLIANTSSHACYLKGYARFTGLTTVNGHRIVVVHDGGVYANVRPRRVVLPPKGVASFGLTYGDAANQSSGAAPSCNITSVHTELPTAGPVEVNENFFDFNICYSGYEIAITPIEAGDTPKARN